MNLIVFIYDSQIQNSVSHDPVYLIIIDINNYNLVKNSYPMS